MKYKNISIILLVIICIIFYIYFAYINTKRLINIGIELSEQSENYSQVGTGQQKILIIGDSSGVGTGAVDNTLSIAGRIGTDFPQATIINKAVNGSKTHDLISILDNLGKEKYDLLLIQIGGNDIVRWTNLKNLEESLDNVLEKADMYSDNIIVMTSGNVGTSKLLPFGTRWIFHKRTLAVRDVFMQTTQKHKVKYIDLYRKPKNDPFYLNPEVYYAKDMFHPSGIGYGDWYSFLSSELESSSN